MFSDEPRLNVRNADGRCQAYRHVQFFDMCFLECNKFGGGGVTVYFAVKQISGDI